MVRPTHQFTTLNLDFDSSLTAGEPRFSRDTFFLIQGSRPPRRPREPLKRYDKGGKARQPNTRPPPEYVRDTEDISQSAATSDSESFHDGSDAGSEASGVNIAELPATEHHPHAHHRSPALPAAETSRDTVAASPSISAAQPKQHRSKRHRNNSRVTQPASRRAHAQMMAETTHQATLNDSRRELWDQPYHGCMDARRGEALLWSYVDDANARMEELEEDHGGLMRICDELIEYLKGHGGPQRVG